jgi:hypothetical protein
MKGPRFDASGATDMTFVSTTTDEREVCHQSTIQMTQQLLQPSSTAPPQPQPLPPTTVPMLPNLKSRKSTTFIKYYHRSCNAVEYRWIVRLFVILLTVFIVITVSDVWHSSSSSLMNKDKIYDTNHVPKQSIPTNMAIPFTATSPSSNEQEDWTQWPMEQYVTMMILRRDGSNDENYTLSSISVSAVDMKQVKEIDQLLTHLQFAYTNVTEMMRRSHRFPSVRHRIQLYMSNWYTPPCDDSARIVYQYSTKNHEKDDSRNTEPETVLRVQEISMLRDPSNVVVRQEQANKRFFEINAHFDGILHDETSFDRIHYMNESYFVDTCTHMYCRDMVNFFLPSMYRTRPTTMATTTTDMKHQSSDASNIPILYQFGDVYQTRGIQYPEQASSQTSNTVRTKPTRYPNIPVIQKARVSISSLDLLALTNEENIPCYHSGERRGWNNTIVAAGTTMFNINRNNLHPSNFTVPHYEPIIFKLKTHRHYGAIYKVAAADTISWEDKKDMAVFRGALTGLFPPSLEQTSSKNKINNNKLKLQELSVVKRCQLFPRCWFTYSHATSKYVDAKLTEPYSEVKMIPRVIEIEQNDNAPSSARQTSIDLYGNLMSMTELLQYKALILLEGNDISSGLKWALFSNSIVMMPTPTLTSWAMEEMLQPWVHYVPIEVYSSSSNSIDGSDTSNVISTTDADMKMQWIIDNDGKARDIAKASKLWIADLVLHPDVPTDEELIFDEMARRYVSHFVPASIDMR